MAFLNGNPHKKRLQESAPHFWRAGVHGNQNATQNTLFAFIFSNLLAIYLKFMCTKNHNSGCIISLSVKIWHELLEHPSYSTMSND